MHFIITCSMYVPAKQSVHVVFPVPTVFDPIQQATHALDPVAFW